MSTGESHELFLPMLERGNYGVSGYIVTDGQRYAFIFIHKNNLIPTSEQNGSVYSFA